MPYFPFHRAGTSPVRRNFAATGPVGGTGSFSLIEVVIAMAIITFALISILGMMTYSSQLVRQADNYARLSNVTRQVLARLDSQAYFTNASIVTNNVPTYFTYDGLPTNSASGYYQCTFSNVTPSGAGLTNLMQVQLIIKWPKPAYSNTNLINTSILNYD